MLQRFISWSQAEHGEHRAPISLNLRSIDQSRPHLTPERGALCGTMFTLRVPIDLMVRICPSIWTPPTARVAHAVAMRRFHDAFEDLGRPPQVYLAINSDDSNIVYYKLSPGIVKPPL